MDVVLVEYNLLVSARVKTKQDWTQLVRKVEGRAILSLVAQHLVVWQEAGLPQSDPSVSFVYLTSSNERIDACIYSYLYQICTL